MRFKLDSRKAPSGARPGFLFTALFALAGFFLVCFMSLWVLWMTGNWAVDKLVDFVPPEWEAEFGKAVAADMQGQGLGDPLVNAAIKDLTARLIAELPKDTPYTFTMTPVWDTSANAFALPGGPMLVTSQLIAESNNPDEVAGILGHEIGHVIHRHSFRAMARQAGMALVLAIAVGDSSTMSTIASGGSQLLGLGFSRENELQADRMGIKLAYEAGFRPAAMADFFRRQQQKEGVGATTERALAFLSTHPANADRMQQIDQEVAKLPPHARSAFRSPEAWKVIRQHAAAIPADVRKQLEAQKDQE